MKEFNEQNRVTIPNEIQDICREFARLAQKHNLHSFGLTFRPPYDTWDAEIHCRWEWGRHGDDANQLQISSDFRVHTKVNIKLPLPS